MSDDGNRVLPIVGKRLQAHVTCYENTRIARDGFSSASR
jgi:hypothetical protein